MVRFWLDTSTVSLLVLGLILPIWCPCLLFADDTLIFCDASTSQIDNFREILSSFEAMLGLHLNLAKS